MIKGKGYSKFGLSPIVTSALLILLVLVLATLIFLWARGFVTEQIEKFGQPIEEKCDDVDFDVNIISGGGLYTLEVTNRGNIDIYHLNVKKIKGASFETDRFEFKMDAGTSVSEAFDLRLADGSEPEEIIFYPVLIGNVKGKDSNKVFTCNNEGKTVTSW